MLLLVIKDQNPPHVKVLSRVPQTLCLLSSGFVLHARLSCVFLSSSPAYHILFLLDLPVMDLPACFWTLIIQPTPHWICLPVWLISRFWPLPELISKLNFPCHFDCLVVVLLGSTPPVPLNVIVQSGQHKPSRLWFTPRAAGGAGQCPSAPWQTTYLYSRRVCRRWRLATRRAWALFRNSSRGSPCWTMDCVLCRPPVLWPRLVGGVLATTRMLFRCSGFLLAIPCTVFPRLLTPVFHLSHREVLGGIYHLSGTTEWERQSPICLLVKLFSTNLWKVFYPATPRGEAARGLFNLTQEGKSMSDFSIKFPTIATKNNWDAASLMDAFYHGLSDHIKDELVAQDLPADLDAQ